MLSNRKNRLFGILKMIIFELGTGPLNLIITTRTPTLTSDITASLQNHNQLVTVFLIVATG